MSHIMGELRDVTRLLDEDSKLLTGLPTITLPSLDLTTIIVVLAIQIAFFVGKYDGNKGQKVEHYKK